MKRVWSSSFIHNYFTDILAMPALLAYSNILLSCFHKQSLYSLKIIFAVSVICGFFWEIVALWIKSDSVCDVWDFVCYLAGAILYWCYFHFYKCEEEL